MPLCKECHASVKQDCHQAVYIPMCMPCIGAIQDGVRAGNIVSNEAAPDTGSRHACTVCRRVFCFMRVGARQVMCWECYGWWKLCSQRDDYVAASKRLFDRLDTMGMGHFLTAPARRLLTRTEPAEGAEAGDIVCNEAAPDTGSRHACTVCRRVCCFMRVGDRRVMCWECYGWWKLCAQRDDYVAASKRLFDRLDTMGMGHFLTDLARRLLTRKEHAEGAEAAVRPDEGPHRAHVVV
eukprot:jgi/Tetstr1/454262/TSEL_041181.t1